VGRESKVNYSRTMVKDHTSIRISWTAALETAELLGTTRWTEARGDDDCVADDRTVQYLIHNLI
jgi:hypothetical protein